MPQRERKCILFGFTKTSDISVGTTQTITEFHLHIVINQKALCLTALQKHQQAINLYKSIIGTNKH